VLPPLDVSEITGLGTTLGTPGNVLVGVDTGVPPVGVEDDGDPVPWVEGEETI